MIQLIPAAAQRGLSGFMIQRGHITADNAALQRASTAACRFKAAERLAVVRLYNVKEEDRWWGLAYVAEGSRTQPPKPQYDPYVVSLDKLSLGKVLYVPSVTPVGDMRPAKQEYVLLPYSHH